jgi:hypothetical protein
MAYNFKSIADVEVVAEPTESANVLIEENGVIKKTPKTAVGGAGDSAGGNVEPDMIVDIMYRDGQQTASIVKGSYDELLSLCQSDGFPNVVLNVYRNLGLGDGMGVANTVVNAQVSKYYGDLYLVALIIESVYGNLERLTVTLYDNGKSTVSIERF